MQNGLRSLSQITSLESLQLAPTAEQPEECVRVKVLRFYTPHVDWLLVA